MARHLLDSQIRFYGALCGPGSSDLSSMKSLSGANWVAHMFLHEIEPKENGTIRGLVVIASCVHIVREASPNISLFCVVQSVSPGCHAPERGPVRHPAILRRPDRVDARQALRAILRPES